MVWVKGGGMSVNVAAAEVAEETCAESPFARFLRAWWLHAPEKVVIELRALSEGAEPAVLMVTNSEQIERFIERHSKRHIYHGTASRRPGVRSGGKS